jgi:hypothetical protein
LRLTEIDGTERHLIRPPASDLPAQQDHAGARAEHRQSVGQELLQLGDEPGGVEQHRHRRRLPARQDKGVHPFEVHGLPNLDRRGSQLLEQG